MQMAFQQGQGKDSIRIKIHYGHINIDKTFILIYSVTSCIVLRFFHNVSEENLSTNSNRIQKVTCTKCQKPNVQARNGNKLQFVEWDTGQGYSETILLFSIDIICDKLYIVNSKSDLVFEPQDIWKRYIDILSSYFNQPK